MVICICLFILASLAVSGLILRGIQEVFFDNEQWSLVDIEKSKGE